MKTKGIILAGGSGSRMFPVSNVYSKQLIMVYDKPMIYYPLSTLMLGGIRDILIISNEETLPVLNKLLGNGHALGINIEYALQKKPAGIAQALIIGGPFIGNDNTALILGDNIFYGSFNFLRHAVAKNKGATIFGYYVSDPQRYGVIKWGAHGEPEDIIEKPQSFVSNYAVPGLYIYDSHCTEIARSLEYSPRGELEITDVNRSYLKNNALSVEKLGRGFAWLDTGTPSSLMDASNFIQTIEKRQSLKIGCIEEVALRMGYIDRNKLRAIADTYPLCAYRDYIMHIVKESV